MSSNIGSRPPSCQNKCNRCIPCQAVQVPTPIERKSPVVSVEYSNYKPEGWRCKCGNKLFNP
ncbi:hypothetical protein SELMODRAFT_86865 [Selaginella moellendorffii]|uniref:Epidermal patterning factor-like protein n=1 Tax=Selaginella moellendorffii TaxID=88036 RepID=D8R8L4_SELML|nr:hypothetical protein SELMODRAFT_86865 [Selaginella moellendorffii]